MAGSRGPLHGIPHGVGITRRRGLRTGDRALADVPAREDSDRRRLRAAGDPWGRRTFTSWPSVRLAPTALRRYARTRGIREAQRRLQRRLGRGRGGRHARSRSAATPRLDHIPASFCGIVGLEPTYGLVDVTGSLPLAWTPRPRADDQRVGDAATVARHPRRNAFRRGAGAGPVFPPLAYWRAARFLRASHCRPLPTAEPRSRSAGGVNARCAVATCIAPAVRVTAREALACRPPHGRPSAISLPRRRRKVPPRRAPTRALGITPSDRRILMGRSPRRVECDAGVSDRTDRAPH